MKIAIFTDTYYPDINGVAHTLKRFTSYLESQNITFKIYAPESHDNDYVSTQIYRFKSLSFFMYPECRIALPNLIDINSELQSFSPDLIHVATPFSVGLCGVYLSKKLNIPLVGSYHTDFNHYLEYYDIQFLSPLIWKYMKWFHSPFKKLFVPSHETLGLLSRHGFSNLEIWPRGVDCHLFHPHYQNTIFREGYGITKKHLLTYVGRLAPEKDLATLLAIAESIPSEINEQIQWLVIGDGPLRAELQEVAPPNMIFTGYLKGEQLASAYCASDLFIFPSSTETFGNVVLESLASGTPVIGAKSGGVKNIVNTGVTGHLCTPGKIEEFTEKIVQLLLNDRLRRRMGFEGREYALAQRWDRIFDHLIGHYSNVIQGQNEQNYA